MSDAEGILIAMCLSRLGCLPLPMQDLLLPGESKKMHLFEARFLSLFEQVSSVPGGGEKEILEPAYIRNLSSAIASIFSASLAARASEHACADNFLTSWQATEQHDGKLVQVCAIPQAPLIEPIYADAALF